MLNISTNRGFTIAELLIVIVVIAILAAIGVVAYSGIQARAKTDAAISTINLVIKKSEAVYAITGKYPASVADFSLDNETKLDGTGIVFLVGTLDGSSGPLTVNYRACGDGNKIVYWDHTTGATANRNIGNPVACSALSGGPF